LETRSHTPSLTPGLSPPQKSSLTYSKETKFAQTENQGYHPLKESFLRETSPDQLRRAGKQGN
jgi:hypothetical protein